MPPSAVPDVFKLALQHHQAGRLSEAGALYRQLLALQPNHPGALHLLGVIALQSGQPDTAAKLIAQSIALDPANADAHSNLGEALRALGRLDDAIACHRRAIALQPTFAQAHYNLGVTLAERDQLDAAIEAYRRALQLQPGYLEAANNLGNSLVQRGSPAEAIETFGRVLRANPEAAQVWFNLGLAFAASDGHDRAADAFQSAIRLRPDHAESYTCLGNALQEIGRTEEALAAYPRALALHPDSVDAHNNMGNALRHLARYDEAVAAYRRALELQPGRVEAHYNLATALQDQGRVGEAVTTFRRALALDPGHVQAHNNLGNALKDQGFLDEAIVEFQRVLQLDPACAHGHNNLGNAFRDQGRIEEALAAYRRALEFQPADPRVCSNLIYSLHFQPGPVASEIAREQAQWNRHFSEPFHSQFQPHDNDRSPDRRLRIGYVSPDFRDHVIGRNLLPLFRSHDRAGFDLIAYSGATKPDEITAQLRQHATLWRSTITLSDEALAAAIRADRIDILVDLSQHLTGNRLPVFARRPAPVQVSFAGYPESTGLEAIPHRLSDRWLKAETEDGRCRMQDTRCPDNSDGGASPAFPFSIFHLPSTEDHPSSVDGPSRSHPASCTLPSFWCYDPCGLDLAVNSLPAESHGAITFGSFNNFCKVNEGVLRTWARILATVPNSRLILLSPFGSHRQRALEILTPEAAASHRVEFVEPRPRPDYLVLYHRVDIVLDPFPYGGHTTSLDALWMGVPVISLAGDRAVSRAGLSQMSNLGLRDLVAFSEDEYVAIATRLASDLPSLAALRRTLRPRMQSSPLMDAPLFARSIESAYRTIWRQWCDPQESR